MEKPLTVGDIRKAIEGLADDAPVFVDWVDLASLTDCDPCVEVCGFVRRQDNDGLNATVLVDIHYLEEDRDDEIEEGVCGVCDEKLDDVESTMCGSMCGECRRQHAEECGVCREDFEKRGLL